METHPKKRLEIFIEAPALNRVSHILDNSGVPGYTVLPVISGSGDSGPWTRDGLVSSAGGMVTIVCIVDEDQIDKLLDKVFKVVSRQIGIINVSDCQVVRDAKFQVH